MTMQQGRINVQTENIFPIIKKFLYSDHEIFLRELVSNAVDATQKLKTLASVGTFKGELGELTIHVRLDKKARTITVSDRGIGMTAEEVDKYINQIAFSSAEDFVRKFKTKSEVERNALIGHFGLGFYSSFMVSEKVEIFTKTYKKGGSTKAVKWECDGSPDYTLTEIEREDRGTDVVLTIDKENKEFLEENRILDILRKYSRFLPIPIQFGTEKKWQKTGGEKDEYGHEKGEYVDQPRIINNTNPLWKKKPVDCTDEDYKSFYRELYPLTFEEPLFHIHLNVDYPFNLTGILYFPKVKKKIDLQKDKIQLYCNQVFVTDSVEGIVPEFLTLLHGVIDSPDIPLNVSRSYLQSDVNVKKISGHISRKVADKLEEIFQKDREGFQAKWDDLKVFIEYGMITDEKFYERAAKFVLLKNTEGKYQTLDEYRELIDKTQKDKHGKTIYLYANQEEEQHAYIHAARERGYDVLVMDGILDNHFLNTLETKLTDIQFKRVDSEVTDKLIEKEERQVSRLDDAQKEALRAILEKNLDKERFSLVFESLSESDLPLTITQPEFMRRMKDMSALGGGFSGLGQLPDHFQVAANVNHPLFTAILEEGDEEKQQRLVKQLHDLALLSQNLLKGESLTAFIRRSIGMIDHS
jgi:molecular chaperone HtpG